MLRNTAALGQLPGLLRCGIFLLQPYAGAEKRPLKIKISTDLLPVLSRRLLITGREAGGPLRRQLGGGHGCLQGQWVLCRGEHTL